MKGHIITRIRHGPPPRNWPSNFSFRMIIAEGPGYREFLEIFETHGIITQQYIIEQNGQPAQRTTICWPKEKHAEVLAMMGRVG